MNIDDLSTRIERVSYDYEQTHGIERSSDWFMLKLHEELGELTQAYLQLKGQARDKGHTKEQLELTIQEEVADVFAHIVLFARHNGVDIESALAAKWFKYLPETY